MKPRVVRNWMNEAHLIARVAAGLGNPLDLTVAEFEAHLRLAVNGSSADEESGERDSGWMRRYVEDQSR
jgi:hypothetical protein